MLGKGKVITTTAVGNYKNTSFMETIFSTLVTCAIFFCPALLGHLMPGLFEQKIS